MPQQKILLRQLLIIYFSAIGIIVLLVLATQAVIQIQISDEISTRDLASIMSMQELRSQRLLRNSLLTLANTNDKAINPLHINPFTQVASDLTFLEKTNSRLLGGDTPQPVIDHVKVLQPDFVIMDQAGHRLLQDKNPRDTKDRGVQVTAIFIHEQTYLSGVYQAFLTLTQQADDTITALRILEVVMCLFTLLTCGIEAFGVVLPTIRRYQIARAKLEEAERDKKTSHATIPLGEPPQIEGA